jgi:hypothetical protein
MSLRPVFACLVCGWVCWGAIGCSSHSHPQASVASPSGEAAAPIPNSAFLAALRSVPPGQRQTYAQQHPDQVAHIMQSPNSLDRTEYTLMMNAK